MKEKKRILISLSRKKSNLLLFGILFFLTFFMLVFLSIYGTSKQMMKEVEKKYGASFMMLLYRDKSKLELWEEREVEGVGTLNYYICLLYTSMLYEYELIPGYWNYEYFSSHDQELSFDPEETKNYMYITQCFPTRNSFRFEQFYNGTFRLVKGRNITPEDKFKCIISKSLAEKNDLRCV